MAEPLAEPRHPTKIAGSIRPTQLAPRAVRVRRPPPRRCLNQTSCVLYFVNLLRNLLTPLAGPFATKSKAEPELVSRHSLLKP